MAPDKHVVRNSIQFCASYFSTGFRSRRSRWFTVGAKGYLDGEKHRSRPQTSSSRCTGNSANHAYEDAIEAMKPIPESLEAIAHLNVYEDDEDLLEEILAISDQVREVVPDCVGLTLAYLTQGISLTMVASGTKFAVLDAIQYLGGELGGGPCLEAVAGERVLDCSPGDLDENGWQLFSQATAAAGIKSTLTLPIITQGQVTGSVNLYGASGQAFVGHHEELADILGSWATAAVTNADLGFTTRETSRQAPRVLRAMSIIDNAAGLLMAADGIDSEAARERLEDAAQRAGVTVLNLAEAMLERNGDPGD